MQFAAIVLLGLFGAIGYGVVHDQITARICIEYFTIGHPPVFDTTSPTLLALGWGIIATWWVGLPLGFGLAIAARSGPLPQRSAGSLVRPLMLVFGGMSACALVAGTLGAVLGSTGHISLGEPLYSEVPRSQHVRFLADLWSHSASYLSGIVGGFLFIGRTWRTRQAGLLYL